MEQCEDAINKECRYIQCQSQIHCNGSHADAELREESFCFGSVRFGRLNRRLLRILSRHAESLMQLSVDDDVHEDVVDYSGGNFDEQNIAVNNDPFVTMWRFR